MNMYETVKQPERKEEIAAARNEVKKYRIAANEIECLEMAEHIVNTIIGGRWKRYD